MKKTKLVGILNITPDSFSDGGLYNEAYSAQQQLEELLQYTPDIIDIGAVSTKPNNPNIPSFSEEIERFHKVLPAILPLLKSTSTLISIDSYNPQTIRYLANKIPIAWINDQSGFINNEMIDLAKELKSKVVLMHHITIPTDTTKLLPIELNIIDEVKKWLLNKADALIAKGIDPQFIILDPGIGFGKHAHQSWELINNADKLLNLGFEVMYGHSRKSFLNLVTKKSFIERDLETAIISSFLAKKGIDFLRIHNVESTKRAIAINEFMS